MKKILLTFLVTFTFFSNSSFASYNFTDNEQTKINTVISKLNTNIESSWENQKKIYINIIQSFQLRDNLSEKQQEILKLLLEWIWYFSTEEESTEEESTEEESTEWESTEWESTEWESTEWESTEWESTEWESTEEESTEWESTEEESTEWESTEEESNLPVYFDKEEVHAYWKDLLNEVRLWEWLEWYTYDESLNITAKKWSDLAVSRWKITHQVDLWDSYYDYSKKATWMKENWVTCENVNRATFSESIAWQEFTCNSSECTTEVKKAIKKSYDFFIAEKWQDYDLHYKAIVHEYFETMWLWLSIIDKWSNKYKIYLTNHYCTTNIQ